MPQDVKITHRTPESLSLSWQRPSSTNGNLKYFMVFYENATQQYKTKIDRDLTNQTFRHQLLYLKQSTKYTLMVSKHILVVIIIIILIFSCSGCEH